MSLSLISGGDGKAKNGADWQYKLYFDPEADEDSGSAYDNIRDEDLMDGLKELVGVDERILNVYAYKVPLTKWKIAEELLFHMFIVFETDQWWWSIEKHSDGITIQRSRRKSAVKDRYRQEARNSRMDETARDEGNMSVHDLITWLYKEDQLKKQYNYLNSNCQHFATAVFNHVGRNKRM